MTGGVHFQQVVSALRELRFQLLLFRGQSVDMFRTIFFRDGEIPLHFFQTSFQTLR